MRRYSFKTLAAVLGSFLMLTILLAISLSRANRATEDAQSNTVKRVDPTSEYQTPEDGGSPVPSPAPDTVVKEFVRAWNQGRASEIAAMFASDGVLIIPTGSQIQSRAEIEKVIQKGREGVLKDAQLSNTVESISELNVERATVKGTYQLEGINILGFSKSLTGSFILHQIKQQGRWLISRAELTDGNQS